MTATTLIRIVAVLGTLSVGLGAFGAHGLKNIVAPEQIETFVTGVRYQFYHTLALLGLAVLVAARPALGAQLGLTVWSWLVGVLLFSGSLYLLSLKDSLALPVSWLGPITPLGGLAFIVGWLALLRLTP